MAPVSGRAFECTKEDLSQISSLLFLSQAEMRYMTAPHVQFSNSSNGS